MGTSCQKVHSHSFYSSADLKGPDIIFFKFILQSGQKVEI